MRVTLTAATGSAVLFLVVLIPRLGLSQQGEGTPRLAVFPLSEAIELDGRLDEPIWLRADSISNLITTEPVEGGSPNGRTIVRVLADESMIVMGWWRTIPPRVESSVSPNSAIPLSILKITS